MNVATAALDEPLLTSPIHTKFIQDQEILRYAHAVIGYPQRGLEFWVHIGGER